MRRLQVVCTPEEQLAEFSSILSNPQEYNNTSWFHHADAYYDWKNALA